MFFGTSITRESFKAHDESKAVAPDYAKNRPIALHRDNFTCQKCFFMVRPDRHLDRQVSPVSPEYSKYLTIHHINGDHAEDSLENMLTVCPFCHNVFHAGCASSKSDTKVVFYPWISQSKINLLANLLISVQADPSSEYHETARLLFEHIDSHFMYVDSKKMFEQGMSDAGKLGSSLMSLLYKNPNAYARRGELLAGLRFIPTEDSFAKAGAVWSGEWGNQDEWQRMAEIWEETEVGRHQSIE